MQSNNIHKSISSYAMIDKIYRDFKPQNSSFVADAIEWIGEAIQGIGYHAGLTTKIAKVTIADHKGLYPCDLERLIAIKYKNFRLPLGSDDSGYGIVDLQTLNNTQPDEEDIIKLNTLTAQYEGLLAVLEATPITESETRLNLQNQLDEVSKSINSLNMSMYVYSAYPYQSGNDYYNTNDDYIQTSFQEGTVYAVYKAFLTDCKGFPKILDDYNYKEAIKWKIISNLILSGYKHPDNVVNYQFADNKWEEFRGIAENEVKVQTVDGQERFTRGISRLKSNPFAWESFNIGMHTDEMLLM
jgi:hypothetical protein